MSDLAILANLEGIERVNGYAPEHQPGFEHAQPFEPDQDYFELRVDIPVVDASLPLG